MDDTPYRELAARLNDSQRLPAHRRWRRVAPAGQALHAGRSGAGRAAASDAGNAGRDRGARLGGDPQALRGQLKEMAKRGPITPAARRRAVWGSA